MLANLTSNTKYTLPFASRDRLCRDFSLERETLRALCTHPLDLQAVVWSSLTKVRWCFWWSLFL